MCPFCMAAIGQIVVAGVLSTGGLTALAVKLSPKKNLKQEATPKSSESSSTGQDRRLGQAEIASQQADAR